MSGAGALAIAARFVKHTLRNPVAIMFVLVVPLAIAFVFGQAEKGANDSLPVGLVHGSGPLASSLSTALHAEPVLRVRDFETPAALLDAVRRGEITAGIELPGDYERVAVQSGQARIRLVGDRSAAAFAAVRAATTLVVDRENQTLIVARRLATRAKHTIAAELARARTIAAGKPVEVRARTAHTSTRAAGLGRVTAGMLIFFMFVVSMDYAVELVKDRRRGIVARMATTATPDAHIVAGEMLGRLAICLVQAVVVIAAGVVLYGIRWGNLIGVAAVLFVFATLSTSASVLIGCFASLSETNAQFTTSGLTAGLGVLGGCFFSLALVPTWLRVAGHVSPHAWAVDALGRLGATDAGIGAIAVPLLVLSAVTVVVFVLAVRQLRAALFA